MRSPKHEAASFAAPASTVFGHALGVVQSKKAMSILAVHNEGRKLVVFEKSKMSNPKIYVINVEGQGAQSVLHVVAGADPRMRGALLDGMLNQKGAAKFVVSVQEAASGAMAAPSTPVPNHYMQKKQQIPWEDPNVEPDIQLGFSWLGLASHT
ncbi:MAG: hypothetical protein ACRDSJ_25240 [Rubrobacteraceae bacterium]